MTKSFRLTIHRGFPHIEEETNEFFFMTKQKRGPGKPRSDNIPVTIFLPKDLFIELEPIRVGLGLTRFVNYAMALLKPEEVRRFKDKKIKLTKLLEPEHDEIKHSIRPALNPKAYKLYLSISGRRRSALIRYAIRRAPRSIWNKFRLPL